MNYHHLVGMIVPLASNLKGKQQNLRQVLHSIRSQHSVFSLMKSCFGYRQEQRLVRDLEMLPALTQAIAQDLRTKTKTFYELREEQMGYLRTLNEEIRQHALSQPPPENLPADFGQTLERIEQGSTLETCITYHAFLEHFPRWTEQSLNTHLHQHGIHDNSSFRKETLFNLLGASYVHQHLALLSTGITRQARHLSQVVDLHKEVILLGRDLLSAREGLLEVRRIGDKVYHAVHESTTRLEQLVSELKHPTDLNTSKTLPPL